MMFHKEVAFWRPSPLLTAIPIVFKVLPNRYAAPMLNRFNSPNVKTCKKCNRHRRRADDPDVAF